MKTHLPKGLRAALMAALASVSITAFVGSSAQAATRLHSVRVESGEVLTLTYDVQLVGVFGKSGGGTLQLANTSLIANADINEGSVEFVRIGGKLPVIDMNGGSFFLHDDASLSHDGVTYTARNGMTGSIKSSADSLIIYNTGSKTTLKDVVMTTGVEKAISVTLDNVSLVNTANQGMWLTGSNITKNLVDVTTGGTLYIGAGEFGNGDTIKATISGTANIGSLAIGSNSTLTVKEGGKLHLGEAIATGVNKLTMASGSTLSVKEGDLFAAAPASGYTLSGVTLEANEGNWTINKAINVKDATITGTHAVAFGSEVDSNAKVTMSGTINATGGNLILKNTTVAANTTATLSGNITFEGVVDNKGTLDIANGSTINIDEESLIRNGHFVHNGDNTAKNGFFADTEVRLSTGGMYTLGTGLNLTLDGENPGEELLKLTQPETRDALSISGFADLVKGTYFVNEGNVFYTNIKTATDQKLTAIAVGNNGAEGSHQLTLDTDLAEGVTVVSASDHAKVLLSDGVVLNASQTAIKGEANELHVTFDKAETAQGTGYVLMDDPTKLSQIAGDATMKLSGDTTTFSTEAKMEGKLVVDEKQTLNLVDNASIASFSSVELGAESKLVSKQAGNDSIKSLSGSGTLDKTGEGTLAISGDSSEFAGSVNIGSGTLEVQNNMNANTLSGSGKLAKTGEGDMTVKDASGFKGDIEATSGTLQLEQVNLTGTKAPQKVSVSNGATVNLVGMEGGNDLTMTELSIDAGTFGVYINGTPSDSANDANVGKLTLDSGGKIVIGSSKDANVLEANLATLSGSILDFSSGGQLTMGCTLDVGKGTIIVLSEDNYALASEGEAVTLFNGIDNTEMENYVRVTLKSASGEQMLGEVNFQSESGDIKLTVKGIPEPTTGTLSLLALAGLCARRRRKH